MTSPAVPANALRRACLAVAAALVGLAACAGSSQDLAFDSTGSSPSTAAASPSTAPTASVTTEATPSDGSSGSQPASAGSRFETLPPGSTLPSDEECATRVRPADEVRPENTKYNQTRGHPTPADADPTFPRFGRVTGNFTGTTDEIIQWTACKWGIDEDVIRAQAAKETYWFQRNLGDFNSDPNNCVPGHPIGADGQGGKCPESIGIMQTRYPFLKTTITDAIASTAYNLDLAYSIWRSCFEGEEQWLNTVDRGQPYDAGDLWGCVGRWFAGRWHTPPADGYAADVQNYLDQRIWTTSGFLNYKE